MSVQLPPNPRDLYRLIICLVMIITCAVLVSGGKIDIAVFIVVLSGVSGYYLGKASDKGDILQ